MAILPLVALVNKGPDVKSFAVLEGLILVPLIAVLLGYLASKSGMSPFFQRSVPTVIGIMLITAYGRFLNS